MVKSFNGRSWRRKKRFALGGGFVFSRSTNYRSLIQQLLHSGDAARRGLKLRRRARRKSRIKLLNLFLRTRGRYYGCFRSKYKKKAYSLNNEMIVIIFIRKQDLFAMLLKILYGG